MTRAREISNVLGRNIESTTFTATAGQTAFSITHAAGRIQVYMNGLLLDPTVDWTSDGSTVTLTEGAAAGDELEVVKHDNLAVADAIPRTGHTGTIDFSDATFTPPAGYVVQVVNVKSDSGQISTTTGQYITTPYSATITPKFATSKVYIDLSFSVLLRGSGSGGGALGFSLKRGSTRLTSSLTNPHEMFMGSTTLMGNRQHYAYLDSPNTTSATTYSLEAYPRYSGQTSEFDSRDSTWSFTLWEIAQ